MHLIHILFSAIGFLFLFAALYAGAREFKDLSFVAIWLAIFACAAGLFVGAIM